MATAEEGLYSRLSTYAGLIALTSTRIYPLAIPQDVALPAVTYQRISGVRDYAMGVQSVVVRARFQVTSWDDSYSGVKAVAEQIRLALSDYSGAPGGCTFDWVRFENDTDIPPVNETGGETGVFGVASDYFIWYREAAP